jgi:hypothetical protein
LVATGVRELKSKMRSSIDVLTRVEFEYVEGKEVMRLVGIFPKKNLVSFYAGNVISKRKVVSNVTNFILKTVLGEAPGTETFNEFILGAENLNNQNFGILGLIVPEKFEENKKYYEVFEIIWLLRILVTLGYWEKGKFDEYSIYNFEYLFKESKGVVEELNNALKNTQLLNV